jgi:hydroxymethylbilane synthase
VTPLRIGTRRSKLAMAQGEEVRRLLARGGVDSELVPMTTSGDESELPPGLPGGLKGMWTDAILDALARNEIDVAVHSAKDLPAEDDAGFVIAAVPERADPRDVLLTRESGLPAGARVGTSSLRRRAQLLRRFEGVEVVELRGNVDTRLRKLVAGEVDAAVLAAAGLSRLGVPVPAVAPLPVERMMPAPGQGALAVQVRDDDRRSIEAVAPLDHRESRLAFEAERSLMWRIGGDCGLPLGALAEVHEVGIALRGMVAMPDGSELVEVEERGGTPEEAAAAAARALIDGGAERILDAVKA